MADHQPGHPVTIDQHDPGRDLVGVALSVRVEPAGRDEDALTGLVAGQCSHERLDRGSADNVVGGVALGLDVDAAQSKGVPVDNAVDGSGSVAVPPRRH